MNNDLETEDYGQWDDGFEGSSESFRNDLYYNAYGGYIGGYGPGGGFGPLGFFPPGPRPDYPHGPPMNMWGRGFGPGGPRGHYRHPADDRAARYLMRCGVPKDVVKNMPKALLDLMKPEYCGVCALHLESFTISRTHYICKNHLKNQKKWISCNHGGYQRGKEMHFKSRDLYCELCDVHITSKAHAESHYAGRPHRAIVEGRKDPKNTFLLQRGMENRVHHLIRREKKNLKTLDENVAVEAPKEDKIVTPELYCDICKTAVTCTEQMTMHLNGKRHLAKEKQHILKMMRGDVGDDRKEKVESTSEITEEDLSEKVDTNVDITEEDAGQEEEINEKEDNNLDTGSG